MGVKIDINSGFVRLPKSNDLRFVRTDVRSGYLQNKDEYLLHEIDYPNFVFNWCYFQKYNIADSILNQIITNKTINSIELYDVNDVLIYDLSDPQITNTAATASIVTDDYGTVSFNNIALDTTALGVTADYYYMILTINTTQTYRSEYFQVKEMTFEDGIYVTYENNETSNYADGIFYNSLMTFKFWLDARIYQMEFNDDKTIFNGFNNKPEILKGRPLRADILEYGAVPWYIAEKLNIAFQHDTFTVNGINYKPTDVISNEIIKVGEKCTLINKGTVKLKAQDYEDYVQIIQSTPEIENNIKWGSTDADYIKWSSNDADRIIYKPE